MRLVILTACSFLVANPCFATDPVKLVRAKDTPAPGIVRTWGDLLDQPPHVLADGTKVRVGIESRHVPSYGAVLVYALVDGPRFKRPDQPSVGPLQVHLRFPKPTETFRTEQAASPAP